MMDSKLVDMYYSLISWDHHKSRDLCFLVEARYEDSEIKYFASHPGYLNEYSADVTSMEEGWEFLNTELSKAVRGALDRVKECQAMSPEDRDKWWLLEPGICEDYLKEVEEYLEDYL